MAFSARTAWDRTESPLARALAELRGRGDALVDLTESNPTRAGIVDLAPAIAALGHARGAAYEPHALGHPVARAAIAERYYARRGVAVAKERVVVTASTSESYAWLLHLLADPGDDVLVPAPSYPLFDWLASLAGVALRRFPLDPLTFRLDFDALSRAIDDRTRAVVLVHPNNPTGTYLRKDEVARLVALAAARGVALVVDEVFLDHAHAAAPSERAGSIAGEHGALAFALGGLSKLALLPQAKLGWIAVAGPPALADEAIARLELVADTYLSVSTPVQLALPELLDHADVAAARTRERLAANLAALDAALAAAGPTSPVRRLPIEGGWYALLEVPRVHDEDAWVTLLARAERVLVQPGWFYDLPREGYLVVSLLPEPERFAEAITRVVRRLAAA